MPLQGIFFAMQRDEKYCTEEKKFFLFEMENRINKFPVLIMKGLSIREIE